MTRPRGIPILPPHYAAELGELRKDLREHAANDEAELATIREDVKSLIRDTASQTTMLERLSRAADIQDRIDEEVTKVNIKVKGKWRTALIGLVTGGLGALVHFLLS